MVDQPWKNRIIGYDVVKAKDFTANPLNFRLHPKAQEQALDGSLATLGWIDTAVVNKTTGHLIDGHERVERALEQGPETDVPRILVELTEDEERQALLSLDPIAAMAQADSVRLSWTLATWRSFWNGGPC